MVAFHLKAAASAADLSELLCFLSLGAYIGKGMCPSARSRGDLRYEHVKFEKVLTSASRLPSIVIMV